MATQRLNIYMREKLAKKLVDNALEKETVRLRKREHTLAERVYRFAYSLAERKLIEKLPRHWKEEENYVRVRTDTGGYYISLDFAKPKLLPNETNGVQVIGKQENEKLAHQLVDFYRAEKELKEKRSQLYRETLGALKRIHTVGSLLKTWPETKPFLEKMGLTEAPMALPAIPVAELNQRLHLS